MPELLLRAGHCWPLKSSAVADGGGPCLKAPVRGRSRLPGGCCHLRTRQAERSVDGCNREPWREQDSGEMMTIMTHYVEPTFSPANPSTDSSGHPGAEPSASAGMGGTPGGLRTPAEASRLVRKEQSPHLGSQALTLVYWRARRGASGDAWLGVGSQGQTPG